MDAPHPDAHSDDDLVLVLAGDVMTGRGIDQVMRHPLPPTVHEPWVSDAREYVRLAERAHGPIPAPVGPAWVWGDALAALARWPGALRVMNLETAVTRSDDWRRDKGIHYRMDPDHVDVLAAAHLAACSLANNHVGDWGPRGLLDTLETLAAAGIATPGAGRDADEARAPAVFAGPAGHRLLVFARATDDSGVPANAGAVFRRPGVARLAGTDPASLRVLAGDIARVRQPGDRVLVSLHWGGNRVPEVPAAQRRFAHALVEESGVDVVHGHSAHHPLPLEVHRGRLVLHGCGDLVNDYEGLPPDDVSGPDLGCLHAATLSWADGRLRSLELLPFQRRRFRLQVADERARAWLQARVAAGSHRWGTALRVATDDPWRLCWP